MTWMAYFEVRLAKLKKNYIYYKMKTLTLHTNCYQPTLKVWAGISVFNSEIRIKKSEDADVG